MLEALHTSMSQSLTGVISFVAVVVLTPLVIRMARTFGWVAQPSADRWHATPTALMGGIAIYAGATAALFATSPVAVVAPIWIGASIMFVTGLVDDLWQIRPAAKLAMQVVATSLLLYSGYAFGHDWSLWLALPLTLIWVVGITNAINLLDNMDGLSAGVAGIAAGVMVVFAAMTESSLAVMIGTPVVGAALGFLVYNFKPAKIFMGDCGSLFLGYIVAALGLIIQKEAVSAGPVAVALVPLAVLAVPIFDTTLVTLVRKLSGRAISQGGRDHSSHRLVFLGLSERHAVLMLYTLSLFAGVAALTALYVGERIFFALTAFVAVALTVLGIQLARANVYDDAKGDGAPPRGFRPLHALHDLMGHHWKALFGIMADALLVGAAFVVSHSLRFDGGVPVDHATQMVQILPLIVALKIGVFYALGLYRGIWRFAGTPEILRTILATVIASVASGGLIAAMYGLDAVSRGVMVIDWMIVMLAVIAVRFGFRGLRQYLASKGGEGKRALLYGAGEQGTLAVRILRHNDALSLVPIGFIDDNPLKVGLSVQGLPIMGTGSELREVCSENDVDVVVVTANITPRRVEEIITALEPVDVDIQKLSVQLDTVNAETADAPRPSFSVVS